MSGLINYSGVTTKVRAMSGHFITEDGYRELTSIGDVPGMAAYLRKNPGYSEVLSRLDGHHLHRGQIESCLTDAVLNDFIKIYRFSDSEQRKFLRRYGTRYEVRFLKNVLNRAAVEDSGDEEPPAEDFSGRKYFFDHYTDLDFDALNASRSVGDVLDALQGTVYAAPLKKVRGDSGAALFPYEQALDLFHFSELWSTRADVASGKNLDLLEEFYGTKFDMLNLWYIHRARTYFRMNSVEIYALTIPHLYRLKKSDIRGLVEAPSPEAFADRLRKTWYGRQYPSLTPDNLQYMYTFICRDTVRAESRAHPYSIAMLYYYLYWKEHEIYRVTTAIECVRYGLSPEVSMKYVLRR